MLMAWRPTGVHRTIASTSTRVRPHSRTATSNRSNRRASNVAVARPNRALSGQDRRPDPPPSTSTVSSTANRLSDKKANPRTEQKGDKNTNPSTEQKGSSATKMCVVCLVQPVCRILLPCGHPCLCQLCSTEQGLAKLKRKCPECRASIREAAIIYGRVVDD